MSSVEFQVTVFQGNKTSVNTVGGFRWEGDAEGFRMLLESSLVDCVESGLFTSFHLGPVQRVDGGIVDDDTSEETVGSVVHQLIESVR